MEDDDNLPSVDYSEWEGKSVKEILEEGHRVLLIQLVAKVRSGAASHQEQAILRNVLKDNGLVLGLDPVPAKNSVGYDEQVADLPDYPDPEYLQ